MNDGLPPLISKLAHDVLTRGPLRQSIDHAVLDGVMLETAHVLCVLGFDRDSALRVLKDEIAPIADAVVFRRDESMILFIYNGENFQIIESDDMKRLAEIEVSAASNDDLSVFGVFPAFIRSWLIEGGRYATAH